MFVTVSAGRICLIEQYFYFLINNIEVKNLIYLIFSIQLVLTLT